MVLKNFCPRVRFSGTWTDPGTTLNYICCAEYNFYICFAEYDFEICCAEYNFDISFAEYDFEDYAVQRLKEYWRWNSLLEEQ